MFDLMPEGVGKLTPRQFMLYSDGVFERRKNDLENSYEMLAYYVAHLLQPYMKKGKKITPEKLFKRQRKKELPSSSKLHKMRSDYEELKKKLGTV